MSILYFDEMAGSPIIEGGMGSWRATRMGKIPWDMVNDFAEQIFPATEFTSLPGYPTLLASGLHVEPFVAEKTKPTSPIVTNLDYNSVNEYEFARVKLEYETIWFDAPGGGGDPFVLLNHRWAIGGSITSLSPVGLKWGGTTEITDGADDKDKNLSVGLYTPLIEHHLTWPQVQNPPFSAMRDCMGKVNSANWSFATGTAAPETLMFLGAELHRDILSVGLQTQTLGWEVGYHFSERNVPAIGGGVGGWNHFMRLSSPVGYTRLTLPDGTTPVFPLTSSFGSLFVEAA